MESDAALSARVLRCVNSAAFSLRTRVTNLQTAIAYLGCKQIRNLAMTASVADLFKTTIRSAPTAAASSGAISSPSPSAPD